jgi:hypothetical protein
VNLLCHYRHIDSLVFFCDRLYKQGRSHLGARGGGPGPPKPQGSPKKKNNNKIKKKKKKIFAPNFSIFSNFGPPKFFFSIWPPQLGGAGSAPVYKSMFVCVFVLSKSTSSSYPILVPFPIFRENFMKNIKKPLTADTLYLDEGVGNE